MELIEKYYQKHLFHLTELFKSIAKQEQIEATKVFQYIKSSFNLQDFRFEINGKDFFSDDDNQTNMEKLLESYYRMASNDQSKKFYLYRIQFTFQEIKDILEFWLSREPRLKIVYIQEGAEQVARGTIKVGQYQQGLVNQKQEQINNNSSEFEENNQFDVDDGQLPEMLITLQATLRELQQKLASTESQQQKKQITEKINETKIKIQVLEQRMKASSLERKPVIKKNNTDLNNNMTESVKSDSPKINNKKITINYKAIFDFYAKQTHLTGVKATFERIQQESQTINYQKLVHFLRQFNILPNSVDERKKVHNSYIKFCQASRVLNLDGFMCVLDDVINILQKDKTKEERAQILKQKILQKNTKNGKILNHPFHSLQKQDFRINVNDLTYNFKIKPQDGKFVHEVNESIQKRRKDKQEAKNERDKKKKQNNLRYLKKLQCIDPFSPLVLKNQKLLQQKSQNVEPIASLQNMQKFRDNSFNFEDHFGIEVAEAPLTGRQRPKKNLSVREYDRQGYKRGEQTQRKVQKLEKAEVTKMQSLMSGIIERNNAKMQKLGISPTKLQKSIKFF